MNTQKLMLSKIPGIEVNASTLTVLAVAGLLSTTTNRWILSIDTFEEQFSEFEHHKTIHQIIHKKFLP